MRSVRLALAVALAACATPAPTALRPLEIERVETLPPFTTNAWAYGRDGGNSLRMGSQILWIFGDTFTLSGLRSATGAWSAVENPERLREAIDRWYAPFQFYPFSATELAFNRAHEDPPACCFEWRHCLPENIPSSHVPRFGNGGSGGTYCRCPAGTDCTTRIALWPGDAIDLDRHHGINYYEKILVGVAPYDFEHLGTGLARVEKGNTVAVREVDDEGKPAPLFSRTEPSFLRAVAVDESAGRFVYVYAATSRAGCAVDILIGRVPLHRASRRTAYRFWNGSRWVADPAAARPILSQITGGLGSVAWNDHLGRYMSGFSDICTGGTSFLIRTAPRPEGPWSDPVTVDLAPLGAKDNAYAGQLHPALGRGRDIAISFYQPKGEIEGRIHLVALTLR